MCSAAGATWLCRRLDYGYRRYTFLYKCFYFTCIAVTLESLLGEGEDGWFGRKTAVWVGLILGGWIVDKVEGMKADDDESVAR